VVTNKLGEGRRFPEAAEVDTGWGWGRRCSRPAVWGAFGYCGVEVPSDDYEVLRVVVPVADWGREAFMEKPVEALMVCLGQPVGFKVHAGNSEAVSVGAREGCYEGALVSIVNVVVRWGSVASQLSVPDEHAPASGAVVVSS